MIIAVGLCALQLVCDSFQVAWLVFRHAHGGWCVTTVWYARTMFVLVYEGCSWCVCGL